MVVRQCHLISPDGRHVFVAFLLAPHPGQTPQFARSPPLLYGEHDDQQTLENCYRMKHRESRLERVHANVPFLFVYLHSASHMQNWLVSPPVSPGVLPDMTPRDKQESTTLLESSKQREHSKEQDRQERPDNERDTRLARKRRTQRCGLDAS